jgi:hypothetical protein
LLDEAKKANPKQAKEVERSRANNLLLINALTPVQNCDVLVKAATATGGES